ncbi:MAG TPA: hypothetical protein VGV35_08170 [Bryobacteraceae bacterium]|nr:hypothetical protein [Bryobacteraceae bacterium]
MESHVKILGLLYILAGGFGGLAGLVFFLLMAGPAEAAAYGPISGYMISGWMILMLIVAVPCIIVGIGLMSFQRWARTVGTVVAILELLNFPLGTALGVYALWILLSPETDPLFSPRFKEIR